MWLALPRAPALPASSVRFTIAAPAELQLGGGPGQEVAISRDGLRLAYASVGGIVVRSIDRTTLSVIGQGVIGGMNLFLSPDGAWVGTVGAAGVIKVPAGGGQPIVIAPASVAVPGFYAGASWGTDGTIVFADDRGLFRVSSDGGAPEALLRQAAAQPGDERLAWPEWLPDQQWVMFTVISDASGEDRARVEALNLESGARKVLVRNASRARYVSSGHLLYTSQGAVQALPWDLAAMEPAGNPAAVVSDMSGRAFAASADGTLVYASGAPTRSRTLVWVDRSGRETRIPMPPRAYLYPRLSPDETRVALDTASDVGASGRGSAPNRDILIWDFQRRTLDNFTTDDPSTNTLVAWSPDGSRLAFGSSRFGVPNLFMRPLEGTQEATRLVESPRPHMPASFTPDGRHLLLGEQSESRGWDVLSVALDDTRDVRGVLQTSAAETQAALSADGRWLAYTSDETGQPEVYVRSFPDVSRDRSKISEGGGQFPLWSRTGRELFYLTSAGDMMAVSLGDGPKLSPGVPAKLFDDNGYARTGARGYDVAKDGRFLMLKAATAPDGSTGLSVTVVHNWVAELERLAPAR
jgi:serine/threonine-protein kinase